MSLLLEALKKAEKAKEEAQRRSQGEDASVAAGGPAGAAKPLELMPEAGAAKPVMTRSELPDISQPLEILTDDIAPPGRSPRTPSRAEKPSEPRASAGAGAAGPGASRSTADVAASRGTARAVFEAKHREPNPKLPFYITLGVLGIAAACTAGYFWYQLRPAPPLVNANPPPRAAEAQIAANAAPAVSGSVLAASPAAASGIAPAAPAIPGLPSAAAAAPATATPAVPAPTASAPKVPSLREAVQRPAPKPRPVRPVRRTEAPRAVARTPDEAAPAVRVERAAPQVHPQVASAYAAYQAGNLAAARAGYEAALREEPGNRDAILGLAAVDVRSGRLEAANAAYQRLLRADPRDPHALAALLALRQGGGDAQAAESRVKNLLAAEPQAHVLNFALGNELARQARWPDAQLQYFKAFSADPGNADYAYNLAVSLDHMRQPRLAVQYYRRALELAAGRVASFDPALARRRLEQLAQPAASPTGG